MYTVDYDYSNKSIKQNTDLSNEDIPYGKEIFNIVDDTIKIVQNESIMEPKARVAYLINPDETEKLLNKGLLEKESIAFTGNEAMEVYYGEDEPTKLIVDSTIGINNQMIKGLDENSKALGEEARKTITFIEYNNQGKTNIEDLMKEHENIKPKKNKKIDYPSI